MKKAQYWGIEKGSILEGVLASVAYRETCPPYSVTVSDEPPIFISVPGHFAKHLEASANQEWLDAVEAAAKTLSAKFKEMQSRIVATKRVVTVTLEPDQEFQVSLKDNA